MKGGIRSVDASVAIVPQSGIEAGPAIGVSGDETSAIRKNSVLAFGESHADFAAFHEGYVSRYIALADTKAAIGFGIASGLLTYLVSSEAFRDFQWRAVVTPSSVLGAVGVVLLALSALCAALVIVPRLPRQGESIVFWGAVAQFKSAESFKSAVHALDASELTDARLNHSYNISRVCSSKYLWLRRCLWLCFAGIWSAVCFFASL